MVDQLNAFASEVTRVAREVGTEGKLGGQAQVPGVAGTWKDLTDNVNLMASNLTAQVRNIAEVTTAVARGDLSRKITVDVKGEILELKNTINTMVDQLNALRRRGDARRARGRHRRQARRPGAGARRRRHVEGPDRQRQLHGRQPDGAGPQHRRGRDRDRRAATSRRRSRSTCAARSCNLKETLNTMVEQLRSFAAEVTRVAREVGTDGKLGGQAVVPGVAGTWKDLTDNVNLLAAQPDDPGPQHRRGDDRRRARRPLAQDHGRREGRDPRAQEHDQHDGRPAERVRRRGDARRARGRHRGQARRPGRRCPASPARGRT